MILATIRILYKLQKTYTSLIDRLKEVVGNSGDAEAIINEELNVVLQGAASDFGVDAVNL